MARRKQSYYGNKKSMTGRRIVLVLALLAVVSGAAWQVYNKNLESSGDNPREKEPAVKDPTVTTNKDVLDKIKPAKTVKPVESITDPKKTVKPIVPPKPKLTPAEILYDEGKTAFATNDFIVARDKLTSSLQLGLKSELDKQARKILNDAADNWLFSRNTYSNDPYCSLYKLATGDALTKIGKKYSVPYQFIMRLNNIKDPRRIKAGQNIKVVNGPFHVVVDRSQFTLTAYLGDKIAYTYPVSVGTAGRSTPRGVWKVKPGSKLVNPQWPDPDTGKVFLPDDPKNPLGERWIGLDGVEGDAKGRTGFGIHGTIRPDQIGSAASRGCIRLLEKDVEVIYDMLTEGKSTVTVVN